ncbi:FAD-containing monooxygenase EthA [Sphingorhabdus lutea]|uniref:FAD-containing monooxygenase EthA n=1 Tax=Sphingorhabdus lutea TaxID=1913578 RepID=A0A1L3JF87_9SPHN|nr:FAD-containing monooxygenase EthA [Sphingorhabdus lutea]
MEQVDMLIIGAGLSGIAAGVHFSQNFPDKKYVILEQRQDMGGTWDLFQYPGIRSDSDMHTLGYRFKPWVDEKAIADGPSIHKYVHATADEFDVNPHIKFGHRAENANWDSVKKQWIISAQHDGVMRQYAAKFLFLCAGYYDYDEGYTPEFKGADDFGGQIIHPQHWPKDLDYSGKKIVVIGSGATAVTIVPVMAQNGGQVTMLQRSPTFMISHPSRDRFANILRKILPDKLAYKITRFRNINMQRLVYWFARSYPKIMRKKLLNDTKNSLNDVRDFEKNFTPRYNPWEQRLCLVPDNDMFDALNSGKAQIITDHIDHFTQQGIKLKSGNMLPADIIVTATGLNLVVFGKIKLSMDNEPVNIANHVSYKGCMFSNIPNMASVFGYVNASWTLKTDIVCDYVVRLLKEMDAKGADVATPFLNDPDMERRPFVEVFSSGYFERSFDNLPKNGDRHPWRTLQNYAAEKKILTKEPVADDIMQFTK